MPSATVTPRCCDAAAPPSRVCRAGLVLSALIPSPDVPLAGPCAQVALLLAIDIQRSLMNADWPSEVDEAYEGMLRETLSFRHTPNAMGPPVWNGLRVRIGMHYGNVEVTFDEVAKGYDYYGQMVNEVYDTPTRTHRHTTGSPPL